MSISLEEFNKLLPNQQRVLIAQDALARLSAGAFIPTQGIFIHLETTERILSDDKVIGLVNKNKCEACAMGGLFISYLNIKNGLTVRDAGADRWGIANAMVFDLKWEVLLKRMMEIFDVTQMALIECAFEGWSSLLERSITTTYDSVHRGKLIELRRSEAFEKAREFRRRYFNSSWGAYETATEVRAARTKLMEAILINIIEHDGEFLP